MSYHSYVGRSGTGFGHTGTILKSETRRIYKRARGSWHTRNFSPHAHNYKTMFGDIQTRSDRMKRLPPVTLRDYLKPFAYALVAVPMLYVFMFTYYVIANLMVGII